MAELNQPSSEKNPQIYELAFLLASTVSEENLPAAFGGLKDSLSRSGAVFISEDFPKSIQLAYPMEKIVDHRRQLFTAAYFGWIKFEFESSSFSKIREEMGHSPDLIRFIIVRTVRESTLAPRRLHVHLRRPTGRPAADHARPAEPRVPIDVEAVDKKIEELIKT